ncbi:MAG: radical SAM family heme chaperone HemW, partial [Chloroflexi bacterium]|nr:radical SAM family heme chaperone HemW [Chloroflexota bacterium]
MSQAIGLYLHIPFCRSKCAYCDFNSYPGMEGLIDSYVAALAREMELWGDQDLTVATLYLGGGTPSLLSPRQLGRLLEAAGRHLGLVPGAEVSLEANPGTVGQAWLVAARRLGVARLSLGVQSFRDAELRLLGRIHSAAEAKESFDLARQAGFANINLDLIYGLPGQTIGCWQATLEAALRLEPDHLSLYCLTLEQGTPLARRVAEQEVPAPDPDLAADMYRLAEEMLAQAGYSHYEISNWARPGGECRHNLVYWRNGPYLGLGAGGHSSWQGYRFYNIAYPATYIRQVAGLCPSSGGTEDVVRSRSPLAGLEAVSAPLERAETVILGLRLASGLSLRDFSQRFGVELVQ